MIKQQGKKVNEYKDLEKTFLRYKKNTGNVSYVSCFGKTFLDNDTKEYKLAEEASGIVVENGFGVLHGGYSGVMEAVSKGAKIAIDNNKLRNKYYNVGVPMRVFDKELERSSEVNLPAAKDISDRKKVLVECCDICLVLPSGGFGTLVETIEIFHLNQLAEKFGEKIRPIIFIKGNWKTLFDDLYKNLDMKKQKNGESFTYFIDSLEELDIILRQINN